MDRSADLGKLQTLQWERLQDLVDRFEQACQQGGDVDLQGFLPPPGDPLRKAALQELIKTDLEIRWRNGRGVELEAYQRQFPELGSSRSLTPRFIFEEYRARQLYGDKPLLAGYQIRFPGQFPELERLARELMTQVFTRESPPALTPVTAPPPPPTATHATGSKVLQVGGGFAYKLLKRIGSGGFAEVFQAEAPGGFPVAVKRIIRPIDTNEAQRELQSLEQIKSLRHPFLLQTQAYYLVDDQLYIVMELADGTLRDRLKECHKAGLAAVPLEELLVYFREAAEALDYMHAQQLLHRDIKPHNLLLLHGHVKVADFGLARVLETQRLMMSASGSGTPAYMAPEVWRNKVSARSDQYSLALTYTELRLGRWPFPGRAIQAIMLDHLSGKPDLAGLPEAEQEVLLKALSKESDQRYESCREFVVALEKALRPEPQKAALEVRPPADELEGLSETDLGPGGPTGDQSPFGTVASGGVRRKTTRPSVTAPVAQAWKPPPPRSSMLWLILPVLALAGGLAWFLVAGGKFSIRPAFEIDDPLPLQLHAGEVGKVTIKVKRHTLHGPIQLAFEGLPDGVRVDGGLIDADQKYFEAKVEALPDAVASENDIVVRATGDSPEKHATLKLTVKPLVYHLPEKWRKGDGASLKEVDGRLYYDKIEVVRADLPVRFLLIPQDRPPPNVPTFYIMEDKVWVGLFSKFAAGHELKNKKWKDLLLDGQLVTSDPEHPVMGVPLADADTCAQWLGGKLPLPRQWDKAAGRYEPNPGEGPYQKPFNKGEIEQQGTLGRGQAKNDVSVFGCRDMAGNGQEWTGKALSEDLEPDDGSRTPLLENLGLDKRIILRGSRYNADKPFKFTDILNTPRAESPGAINPYIGFRVVLEPEQ